MLRARQAYDQKNIRRRVYDALNVLMAMNIISKEKKEIKWIGLPTNSAQECRNLEVTRLGSLPLASRTFAPELACVPRVPAQGLVRVCRARTRAPPRAHRTWVRRPSSLPALCGHR